MELALSSELKTVLKKINYETERRIDEMARGTCFNRDKQEQTDQSINFSCYPSIDKYKTIKYVIKTLG